MVQQPQRWEYWLFPSSRLRNQLDDGTGLGPWDQSVVQQLQELGEDRGELVAVTPRSGLTGEPYAGFTTDMLWVFKRPKM
jgi:hypothetical protein